MTKYEKQAKELIEQMQQPFMVKDCEGFLYCRSPNREIKECALILCNSHIYSENNSPFYNLIAWHDDHDHWQKVKEAIKAIEV